MASYYFQFLTAFLILLRGIQGGLVVPPSQILDITDSNNENHQMGVLYNRFDQLEAKVEMQEVKINSQQKEIDQLKKKDVQLEAKVEQHEGKINSQQTEINQLKKKNSDLEEKNNKLILIAGAKKDDATSHASSLPRSCFELKATNPSAQSGVYLIDPDGQIGADQPIQVYCDMATKTTSIYHDTEAKTKITACLDPGCYTKAITYNATLRQLAALADISSSCKQHIRFDSFVVPLEYNNARYGYWNDRNNIKQIFWAGPATTNHTCQCGISKNCIEKNYKCNSDSLAPIELVDEGYITATELLPVTRLSFGRTSLTGVKASYTLGRFECTGQAAIPSKPSNCRDLFKTGHTLNGFYDVDRGNNQISSVYCDFSKSSTDTGYETRYAQAAIQSEIRSLVRSSSKPTNCQDLFKMGHTLSGFYDVKGSSTQISSTYCDFSKSSTEMDYETRYGYVDVKTSSIHFFVTRTSIWNSSGNMAFDKEYLNLGGGMNLASGVFKAPKAGIYTFSFRGEATGAAADYTGYGIVHLTRNGVVIASGHSDIYDARNGYLTLSVHGTLKLNKGDTITIGHTSGTIYSSSNSEIQFMGSMLEEDLVIP